MTSARHARTARLALLAGAVSSIVTAAAGVPPPPPAPALEPRREAPPITVTAIDRALAASRVRLVSGGDGSLSVISDDGVRRTLRLDSVLAIVAEPSASAIRTSSWLGDEPTPAQGWITFTDGQKLHGTLLEARRPESARWRTDSLGEVERPLEEVRSIVFDSAQLPDGAGTFVGRSTTDQVLFANGDRVEGFVSAVGPTVTVEKSGRPVSVPAARVSSIRLANPAQAKRGVYAWLADGSVVKAESVSLTDGQFDIGFGRAEGAPPALRTQAAKLSAVLWGAERMTPLSALPMGPVGAGPGRRWTAPARLGDEGPLGISDIDLPGPMTVEWTLPPRAERLGAELVLPPECRVWGDCRVVIESVKSGKTAEIYATRLNASAPEANFAASVEPGAVVRIRVEEGEGGAIQDRVVIRRAMVLTK
jgi:hypothetical protein